MKKKIYAFYDVLVYSAINVPLIILGLWIHFTYSNRFRYMMFKDIWYLFVIMGLCTAIPMISLMCVKRCEIDISEKHAHFHYLPLRMNDIEKISNGKDKWNRDVCLSEIVRIEIVRLSKEEISHYTDLKYAASNKYLKVDLKDGKTKHIYVGTYTKYQIDKIIKMLMTPYNNSRSDEW